MNLIDCLDQTTEETQKDFVKGYIILMKVDITHLRTLYTAIEDARTLGLA